MAQPVSLHDISQNIHNGKSVTKIENQRLYETDVYTIVNEERQTCVFWSPVVECMKKDDNHMTVLLPQIDECEQFYNDLTTLEANLVNNANEKWKNWFPKDELTFEDIQDRFVSCIKAGSKEEQGRIMNIKTSSKLKCKIENCDDIHDEYFSHFDSKTRKGKGVILIELRRVVFGRGNFKPEFIVHQVLLNEPEVQEPETQRFNNESWVNFA